MKIGIYDPYLDALRGGEKYMLTIASCLSKNHAVSLFWDKESAVIQQKAKSLLGIDLKNIKFASNIFSQTSSFVRRFRTSKAYDLIFFLSDGSIPLVGSSLIVHFQSPMEWLKTPGIKERLKIKRVKKIICNSYYTKSFIDKKIGVNSIVIYPPVDPVTVKQEKENIILNVGKFGINWAGSSFKKQDFLVETFQGMVDSGLKNWKLVLVVSVTNEHKSQLELLKKSDKSYPIEIHENISQEELHKLYAKSKIYWHASGYGEDLEKYPDRAEHFGISTVEAMSAGVVPIVINAGGQSEIVKNGQTGLLWNTQNELISSTHIIIQNVAEREKLAKNAKIRARDFNVETFCRAITNIIS